MAASSAPVTASHKRARISPHGFSAESCCLDLSDCVYPSFNKRKAPDIVRCNVSPRSSSSSASCLQPLYISFFSGTPFAGKDIGTSLSRSPESSAPVITSSSTSALIDKTDSAIESSPVLHGRPEQELLCWVSSDEEAGSCCGGNDTLELDVPGFLLQEVWDDDAVTFDPEMVDFFNGGASSGCFEDDSFTGCCADNGNWFLNDLESEGYGHLNEVLDQEWMAAAASNLDRINDTLDTDLCVLHLFESDYGTPELSD